MRWSRSFCTACALLGLSFFAIAPSKAFAEERYELPNDGLVFTVIDNLDDENLQATSGGTTYPYVEDYHYSHEELIATNSVVSADYIYNEQHTGMFGGYLDVPSINTTASGTLKNNSQANSGLFWNTDWYFAPYKRQGESQWGYKPMLSNSSSSYGYNAWVLSLNMNTTSDMTSGGYHIDMSHATSTGTATGTQTKEETQDTTGTLSYHDFSTLNYKFCPYTASGDGGYKYLIVMHRVNSRVSSSADQIVLRKGQSFEYMPTMLDCRFDSPTGFHWDDAVAGIYVMDSTNTVKRVASNRFTAEQNYLRVGVIYRIPNWRTVEKGILIQVPHYYITGTSVEQTVTEQTQQQTAELKDTTGSDTTVTNAQGVFDNTIKSKLGFVSQTADITTGLFDALTYEGEGTVPFPALKWQGQTIIAAQNVPILGYLPEIEDDVKTGVTLVLFLAWLHGIHSLYARMFLGETMVEVDEQ